MASATHYSNKKLLKDANTFMEENEDIYSSNCIDFVSYVGKSKDKPQDTNNKDSNDPIENLFLKKDEITTQVYRFINDAFLKSVGDYDETISDEDQSFMVEFFQLLNCIVKRPLLMRKLKIHKSDFPKHIVWEKLMLKPGHKNFSDKETKVKFHSSVLSAFYNWYLGTRLESYGLVKRGAIYSLDPYTRQLRRRINRAKMRKDSAWGLFQETKPLVFLQQLLTNQNMFRDIPFELFEEETPIYWSLRIILRLFEIGLFDRSDCDVLISTIDCFASQVQAYFDAIQSNKSVLEYEDEETITQISTMVVKSQQTLVEILLHITSVYSDEAFMDSQPPNSTTEKCLFFEEPILFSNVAHILVKCCTYLRFDERKLSSLIKEDYLMFSNFKQDWVTLLTYLTDPSFDHFIDSCEVLSIVDRCHKPFMIQQNEVFISSRINKGVELLNHDLTKKQEDLISLITDVPVDQLNTERLARLCDCLKSILKDEFQNDHENWDIESLKKAIEDACKSSSKLAFEPQYGILMKMASFGFGSTQKSTETQSQSKAKPNVYLSHRELKEQQTVLSERLRKRTAIDHRVTIWFQVNNIAERISKVIADCIHLSKESLSEPNSQLREKIHQLTDLLAIIIHQSVFDQAALFSDPFESEVISKKIKNGTHFYQLNFEDVIPSDSLFGKQGTTPPQMFPSWGTICYFQPVAFSNMIQLLFTGNFELLLHDKHAFCNLLVYYDVILRSFYRTLTDQGNYVTDFHIEFETKKQSVNHDSISGERNSAVGSQNENRSFEFKIKNDSTYREFNLQLKDLKTSILIFNKLLKQLLKEYTKRNNYSKGYHYFTRICDMVHGFVQIFVFSEEVTQGSYTQIWGKFEGSVFIKKNSDSVTKRFLFSNSGDFKELHFSFLKLLNVSISGFWKPELMSSIRARFMKKAALVFNSELKVDESLNERIEYFRLYDTFFNYEKSTLFDEFQLLTGNPDIGLIIEKFKPKDFNAIYRNDNMIFLLEEARKIIKELQRTNNQNDTKKKMTLIKYTWDVFLWSVYKLFKGVTASFYTKIKGINFFVFENSVRSLFDHSKVIIKSSLELIRRELINCQLSNTVEKLIENFDLDRDSELDSFSFQTIATGSDPDYIIVKDHQMEKIRKVVAEGVDIIFLSLGLFYQLHSDVMKNGPADMIVLRSLDRLIGNFHLKMWNLESRQDIVQSGDVVSAADFNVPSQPAKHWSEDQNFTEVMNNFSQFIAQTDKNRNRKRLQRFIEEQRKMLEKKASTMSQVMEEQGRQEAVREQRSQFYPKEDRLFIKNYIKTKEKQRIRSEMRDNWRGLFDSRFDVIAIASSSPDQESETERKRTLENFATFMIDFCRVNNYYLEDVVWSLSYFDSKMTTLNLNFEYFMKNVPDFQDAANKKVNEFNEAESNDRNALNYNKYSPISVTLHENFYELYFNLLNLMYWRLNDAQFMWMHRQFVTLNQLIRTINNVRETATASKDLAETIVRNPVHQMLVVLRFLTENSRLHLNTKYELSFSDRVDDLPLYSILLSNLSYAVKTYRKKQINYDSSYFKFLNMIVTRKVNNLNSPLYMVQYSAVEAVQSFLLKSSPESLTGLWNSFDYRSLYDHMIWLVKFWFCRNRIEGRINQLMADLKQLNKERLLARSKETVGPGFQGEESLKAKTDVGNDERSRFEEAIMIDNLMNDELVGFWDRFTARVGVWKYLSWSNSAEDKVFSFLTQVFNRVFLILDIDTFETRSEIVTSAMRRHYRISFGNEASPENQTLRAAVQIYIFLKYLGCFVSDVQEFLIERERRASEFVIDSKEHHPEDHTKLIAENKALLFLNRIVKRIEINRPSSAEPDAEVYLFSIYFRVNPLSLFRTTTIAQDFMEGAPATTVEAQRTFLLENNDELLSDLQKYRHFFLKFWPLYFLVQPSMIRFMKSLVSVICVVLNILLVVYVKGPEDSSNTVAYESNGQSVIDGFGIAFIVVSAVYCLLVSLHLCTVNFSKVGRSIQQKQRMKLKNDTFGGRLTYLWKIGIWISSLIDEFWFAVVMILCSALGKSVNLVFFTLAFLTIILELRYFRYIAQAVIIDLRRLGLLFFFLICLLVCVAYITIVYFAHDPNSAVLQSDCSYYLSCFFNIFNKGYRAGGGIGEVLTQVTDMSTDKFWASFFFTIIYFLLVKQILFNIVFGIIQDNFGDARTTEEEAAGRANYCPICDKDIWAIERGGSTFYDHVAVTHNQWTYQDYLIFLSCSNYSSLTDHDVEIKKKNEKFDFSWMPSKDYLTNPYRPKKAVLDG